MSGAAILIRHVVVHGQVQGVGFRAFVEDAALELGIAGWVRNRRDGTVEAVVAGPADAVTQMIEACRRGPRWSQVDRVDIGDAGDELLGDRRAGFSVRPTV